MTRLLRRLLREDGGATLALTAVMIAGVMSMLALALDLGQMYTAKVEAQRAADSGALAGASVFLNILPASNALTPAEDKAIRFATMNMVRHSNVDTAEVQVQVNTDLRRVWVQVERQDISLWFARLFGQKIGGVRASAEAQASPANQVDCIAPLAMPDWWNEAPGGGDADNDRIWDENENWEFDPLQGDSYERYTNDGLTETGLGSMHRNGWGNPSGQQHYRDQGREMIMKAQDPHQWSTQTGWFFPIRLPLNAPGTTNKGAQDYQDSFTECRSGPMTIGQPVDMEMGNMVGPTRFAIEDVVAADSTASWNVASNSPNSPYGWNSPRLLTIVLFDPNDIQKMKPVNQGGIGQHTIIPNNFALYWVEGFHCPGQQNAQGNCPAQSPVKGRFVQFAQGTGGGPSNGSLVLQVQLIK